MSWTAIEAWLRRATGSFAGAVFGALAYAAWATFANWDAGARVALSIGVGHWLSSTFITYSGTGLMRLAFVRGVSPRDGAFLAFTGGLAYTYSVLLAAHTALGTPHIALTLAAGVIPNLLFCSSYALLLAREPARVQPPPTLHRGTFKRASP